MREDRSKVTENQRMSQLVLITCRDWADLKEEFPKIFPEGTTPEEAGFMLYHTPEQVELLQNLKRRWEGE